jgi:hypothetical protein
MIPRLPERLSGFFMPPGSSAVRYLNKSRVEQSQQSREWVLDCELVRAREEEAGRTVRSRTSVAAIPQL